MIPNGISLMYLKLPYDSREQYTNKPTNGHHDGQTRGRECQTQG